MLTRFARPSGHLPLIEKMKIHDNIDLYKIWKFLLEESFGQELSKSFTLEYVYESKTLHLKHLPPPPNNKTESISPPFPINKAQKRDCSHLFFHLWCSSGGEHVIHSISSLIFFVNRYQHQVGGNFYQRILASRRLLSN